MFTVHWKYWDEKEQEWAYASRKVKAKNPDMAKGVIMKEYPGAIFQKVKKA